MSYSRTHVLLPEDGPTLTAADSPLPRFFPFNQMEFPHARDVTFVVSVAAVNGAPSVWSLGVKFQFCQVHTSGLYLESPRWYDIQEEQVAALTAEGVGWYSGLHPKPAAGEFGIIADQTDSALPITVSRTIRSFGQRVRIVVDPQFTGGTTPSISAGVTLIERG